MIITHFWPRHINVIAILNSLAFDVMQMRQVRNATESSLVILKNTFALKQRYVVFDTVFFY